MLCAGLLRRDRATTNDRGGGERIVGCSAKDGRAARMARHCWRTWPRPRASEEGMSDFARAYAKHSFLRNRGRLRRPMIPRRERTSVADACDVPGKCRDGAIPSSRAQFEQAREG